jgi:hypothetical protein
MGRPKVDSVCTVAVDTNLKARRTAPNTTTLLDHRTVRNNADSGLKVALVIVLAQRFTETFLMDTGSFLKSDEI